MHRMSAILQVEHKIPKSSYNDNNSVWIGREQLNLGPNVINTASGAHMRWGNRCQIQNTNIHQFQIQNTKIHRFKIQKYNNASRQPLPNMKYKYYRPMPNTKYKLANHCQIQNTVYTQYSLLSRYWDTINKERLFEFAIWRMMLAQTEARSRYDFAQILIYLSMESLPWCSCHSWDTPLHQRKYNIKRWIRKIYEECENPDLLNFWSWI